jgi:branched-chain amino acid transport system substrate-binding protein
MINPIADNSAHEGNVSEQEFKEQLEQEKVEQENIEASEDDDDEATEIDEDGKILQEEETWLLPLGGAVLLIIGGLLFFLQNNWFSFFSDEKPLYIAVAGPMSGKGEANGQAMVEGIQLYLDEINSQGGINNRPLKLLLFDDQNESELAQKVAVKIANHSEALAVIGHFYSSTSIAAAPLYQHYGIPAISGTATADELTVNNDWYFRTSFNNSEQGALLANYVYKVLKYEEANVLFDKDAYGSTLASTFYENAKMIGLEVTHQWDFDSEESFQKTLKKLTKTLAASPSEKTVLFLATHSTEAAKTLLALKNLEGIEVEIVGADALSSHNFMKKLQLHQQEQIQPGYYSDGVYTTAPLLFDLASQVTEKFRDAFIKKYDKEPSVTSVMYYDSAMVIVDAIKKMLKEGKMLSLKGQRQKVQESLWQLSQIKNAIEGVTGSLYFDEKGDMNKPIPIGVYQKGRLVAAMRQYQPLQSVQNIDNLLEEMLSHRIVEINGKFMNLAQLVYAGIDFTDITELNTKDSTFTADFYIWFRFKGDFDDRNIEFVNLFKPKKNILGEPISVWSSPVDPEVITRTYRVRDKFKIDLNFRQYPIDQQILSIYFRHNELTRNKLIYVIDIQGMGLDKLDKQETREFAQKFFSIGGWYVNKLSFFQEIQVNDSTWGITDFFDAQQRIEYSQFTATTMISRHVLSFILKTLLPVVFLVVLGYVAFFINAFGSKLGIGTNLILATSLFHLKLASELPNINYIVLIEYFFYLVYLLSVFIIIIAIITHLYEEDESEKGKKLISRLNLAGKIVYPLLLMGFVGMIAYQNALLWE